VLVIDLDNFKNVNDALGHQVGDRALQEATARLVRAVREHDTVARLGGDEFAVLCAAPVDLTEALRVAERVRAALDEPFPLDGRELGLSCSVGVKLAEADNDASAVLRDADAALNRAKSSGRNCVHLFDDALAGGALARLEMESDLRVAIPRRQLHLVFQPEVRIADGHIVAVETLVRWTHPGRGPVSPAEFIPLAEETGLIGELGRWVVEGAVRQAAAWCVRFGDDAPMVSINISGVQFDDPSFVPELAALLDEVGVPPAKICAEITETTLITDPETALAQALRLRELGVRLAIDDFGTGYSSLAYLRRYPLNYLKVDQSFVRGLGVHDGDEAVVRAVTELAHALGLEVIAEGVETADQRDFLREIGCGLGQGWLYSRGVPAGEIDALLEAPAQGLPRE
jgi:diguanylate cyclase (GGDEF)-like protein